MATLRPEIRQFLGANDDSPATSKEIDETGTVRMSDLANIDPAELPALRCRPSWGLVDEAAGAKIIFPRRFA